MRTRATQASPLRLTDPPSCHLLLDFSTSRLLDSPIPTPFRADPHLQHVAHIVPSIVCRAHLASRTVDPDDRYRADAVAALAGDGQQFDVERGHARAADGAPWVA